MTFDQPSECPFYLISRVTLQVTSALKKGMAAAGIDAVKPAYLGVLLCLWAEDGRKAVELARCARLEPSSMTGLLDRMARDGLVSRTPDPNDRRVQRICLTDAGMAVRTPAEKVTTQVLGQVFDGIAPADLARTMEVLQQVLTNIKEDSPS
ncbi:MAG: MarR family transcriptional regulator [Desulfosarcina sp.]|nr:MarR family transcriptional regulator [Desulfobacterales bacterium]